MSDLHLYRVELEKTVKVEIVVEATDREDAEQQAEFSVDWYEVDSFSDDDIDSRVMCEITDKNAAEFAKDDVRNSTDNLTVDGWFDHETDEAETNPKPHPNQMSLLDGKEVE